MQFSIKSRKGISAYHSKKGPFFAEINVKPFRDTMLVFDDDTLASWQEDYEGGKQMSDLRINFIDNWEKKNVNLAELESALESGNSSIYTNPRLNKVASKWKKFAERGVSNLYLIKELDDDGVACACYAYSIKDGIIDEES